MWEEEPYINWQKCAPKKGTDRYDLFLIDWREKKKKKLLQSPNHHEPANCSHQTLLGNIQVLESFTASVIEVVSNALLFSHFVKILPITPTHAENLGCIKKVTTMIPNGYHENVACYVVNSKLVIIWQKESNYKGVLRLFGNREEFADIAGHQKTMNQFCVSHVQLSITQSPTNLRFLHPPQADEKQVIFLQELRAGWHAFYKDGL